MVGFRGRDERVGAVVQVQQRALRALEEHVGAGRQRVVHDALDRADERGQALGPLPALGVHVFKVHRVAAVDLGDNRVGVFQDVLQPRMQGLDVEQVGGPEAGTGGLVGIGGADALACGAYGGLAARLLG